MPFKKELITLFKRDLDQLIKNLEQIDDSDLWRVPSGVTNSCGVLAQHIAGNLNHFIGTGLGDTGYVREREREFTNTQRSQKELIKDLRNVQEMISIVLNKLNPEQLDEEYPLPFPFDSNIRETLIHLYGHLSYHMGQINYLRRILAKE